MRYFSNLFDKVLYMFRTGPLYIIRRIAALYTQQQVFVVLIRLTSASVATMEHPDHASSRQQNQHDKYLLRVYSVEKLLMMQSGPVRNMLSTLSNKPEKQFISLAFIIRIYHDAARSSECQIYIYIWYVLAQAGEKRIPD